MNVSRRGLFSVLAGGSASVTGLLASLSSRAAAAEQPLKGWNRATVQSFDKALGYGFLMPERSRERIFVHICGVRASGLEDLEAGQIVDVKVRRMKSPFNTQYRAFRIEHV
jgi:cold shock CspA family protein